MLTKNHSRSTRTHTDDYYRLRPKCLMSPLRRAKITSLPVRVSNIRCIYRISHAKKNKMTTHLQQVATESPTQQEFRTSGPHDALSKLACRKSCQHHRKVDCLQIPKSCFNVCVCKESLRILLTSIV